MCRSCTGLRCATTPKRDITGRWHDSSGSDANGGGIPALPELKLARGRLHAAFGAPNTRAAYAHNPKPSFNVLQNIRKWLSSRFSSGRVLLARRNLVPSRVPSASSEIAPGKQGFIARGPSIFSGLLAQANCRAFRLDDSPRWRTRCHNQDAHARHTRPRGPRTADDEATDLERRRWWFWCYRSAAGGCGHSVR